MAEDEITIDDPRVLRAIAHPVRMGILERFDSGRPLRAVDLADEMEIPANQASFHLRQLAKYGLIVEAPEAARDGRDRVWKRATVTINVDTRKLNGLPGGRAAVAAFQQRWVGQAHEQIDKVAAFAGSDDGLTAVRSSSLRLTRDEAKALIDEIGLAIERWRDREPPPDAVPFEMLAVLGMVPES